MSDTTTQITLSQNEVESLAAKAARGAGLPWGAAEEAGFAAGWLHNAGVDGLTPLLAHLGKVATSDWSRMQPRRTLGGWESQTPSLPLCPIALGTALSDFAESNVSENGLPSRLVIEGEVAFPVLVLPFLSVLIPARIAALEAVLNDVCLTVGHKSLAVREPLDLAKLLTIPCSAVQVVGTCVDFPSQLKQIVATPAETLAGLGHLALQTTVPPSARSRADAGASGSDND